MPGTRLVMFGDIHCVLNMLLYQAGHSQLELTWQDCSTELELGKKTQKSPVFPLSLSQHLNSMTTPLLAWAWNSRCRRQLSPTSSRYVRLRYRLGAGGAESHILYYRMYASLLNLWLLTPKILKTLPISSFEFQSKESHSLNIYICCVQTKPHKLLSMSILIERVW